MRIKKTYKEMLEDKNFKQPEREELEWSNFWYNIKDEYKSGKRILLMGDSNMRMVRSRLQKAISCPTDLFATSSSFADKLFASQVDAFFCDNTKHYDAIMVQYGYHSLFSKGNVYYTDEDYEAFEKTYLILIEYLKQFTSKIVICSSFFAVIPPKNKLEELLKRFRFRRELFNNEKNEVISNKNRIAESVARKSSCSYLDINTIINTPPTLSIGIVMIYIIMVMALTL